MAKKQPRLSFGGARLILFGDPYQLPPVEPDPYTPSGELFRRHYKSPFFFSSQVLRTWARKIKRVEFTRVFRQNEADFLATLDRCRSGMVTDASTLNSREIFGWGRVGQGAPSSSYSSF